MVAMGTRRQKQAAVISTESWKVDKMYKNILILTFKFYFIFFWGIPADSQTGESLPRPSLDLFLWAERPKVFRASIVSNACLLCKIFYRCQW